MVKTFFEGSAPKAVSALLDVAGARLSEEEIAERTERSNDAVRSSLSRVKRQLIASVEAQALGGRGHGLERGLA